MATDCKRLNVADAVQRAVAMEAGGEWHAQIDVNENLQVLADKDYLVRALANLLRNAYRYAGPDGPVSVTAKQTGNEVCIVVNDNGTGVPENALEEIFKPFYRIETARDRKSGGTGLGLAIVRSSVEAMKGTVRARNLKPRGFAVEINLCCAIA